MKECNIPFCKEIPDTWKEVPNKYLFEYHSVKVGDKWKDYQLLSLTTSGVKEKDINASGGKVPDSYDKYQTVEPGDMIFCLFDLDVSAVFSGLSHHYGMITSAYDVVRPNHKLLNQNFSDFWFQYVFTNRYYKMYSKNIRFTIGSDMFKAIATPIPPMDQQRKIAGFLNQKTEEIDSLIEIENQQIEKLKEYKQAIITEIILKGLDKNAPMKDSGVKWIGMVPESYNMMKMGWLANYKKGPFGSSLKISMFVPKGPNTYKVYEQKNAIYKDETLGYYYISKEKFDELSSNEVLSGDIIVSCAGTIGECFQMPSTMEPGIINQALMRVRLNEDIIPQYYLYLFDAVISKESQSSSNGSAMKNIPPFDVLKNIRVFIPNKDNQTKVVNYLDQKCKEIDVLISIKQKKIDDLDEYKKSIIYEYVTGKKEVC